MKKTVSGFLLLGGMAGLFFLLACGGGGSSKTDLLLFNAVGPDGAELWVMDDSGLPEMVDIDATTFASPGPFSGFNGKVYFRARDATHSFELWEWDGANAPEMVADINTNGQSDPGEDYNSLTGDMVVLNNKMYFDAYNGSENRLYELTTSNSLSIATTACVWPNQLAVYDNKLFFSCDDGMGDYELWSFDGSVASVADSINPSSSSYPRHLVEFNDGLYFSADNDTNGKELWVFESSTGSARLVTDLFSGGSSNPSEMTVFNGKLYFNARDQNDDVQVWAMDQSEVCTTVTGNYPGGTPDPGGLTVMDGMLYFQAQDAGGQALWTYSGSASPVKVSGSYVPSVIYKGDLAPYQGVLYFRGNDVTYGTELWRYDTMTAPSMVADLLSPGDFNPRKMFVWDR